MFVRESQQVSKQLGFVLAVVMIGAQAVVGYFSLVDDGIVAMWQFHVTSLLRRFHRFANERGHPLSQTCRMMRMPGLHGDIGYLPTFESICERVPRASRTSGEGLGTSNRWRIATFKVV
jgi:hypothetical protein